jgi:hypothetical protein
MSSSPAAGDAPPLDDALFSASGDAAAALLVRERLLVVAVPRLADLDVLELEEAGDAMRSSTSSRPGRESKLRRRAGAPPRARDLNSIHRVALKESRNRTLAIASRRLPSTDDDDRFFALGVSSSMDGDTLETTTACFSPVVLVEVLESWPTRESASGGGGWVCVDVESGSTCLVRWRNGAGRRIIYSGCRC